jgi:cysteine-rich repeat protein
MSMGATCGDGVVQVTAGEQCDDGNDVDFDGCTDCSVDFG